MSAPEGEISLRVRAVSAADTSVVEIELESADGSALPSWSPGAHIDLILPTGLVRQYSLTGSPSEPIWRLGVLREDAGRGGSRWLAERLRPGAVLPASRPRNHFALPTDETTPLVFIAGGIGITPLVPLAAAAGERLRGFHYCGHLGRMPFLSALREVHAHTLSVHVSEEGERLDIERIVDDAAARGAELVTCGPARLLDAVQSAAAARGVVVHLERFEPEALSAPVWSGPFDVELTLTGVTVEVPPEKSILEVAEESGALVLSSCTEGTCGTCETPVLEGIVDHRDSILTPAQRARNDTMFICVSRAACPRLVLEL